MASSTHLIVVDDVVEQRVGQSKVEDGADGERHARGEQERRTGGGEGGWRDAEETKVDEAFGDQEVGEDLCGTAEDVCVCARLSSYFVGRAKPWSCRNGERGASPRTCRRVRRV